MMKAAIKGMLRRLGILQPVLRLKRLILPPVIPDHAFRPCTPHLLIAIGRSLRWLHERSYLSGACYLEFGLFRGFSLWYAQKTADDLGETDVRYLGFDSFEGLPRLSPIDQGGEFVEHAYACTLEQVREYLGCYGIDWTRTHLIKGWFDRTLQEGQAERYDIGNCRLCVIDCDLYESTVPVLRFIGRILDGPMIVLFDDWNSYGASDEKGERRAFREFLREHPHIVAEDFISFGGHGQGFILHRTSHSDGHADLP